MKLEEAIKNTAGALVVVDDALQPPNFAIISSDALTAMYQNLAESEETRKQFTQLLGIAPEKAATFGAEALMGETDQNLGELWKHYIGGMHDDLLKPLFNEFGVRYYNDRRRIDTLIKTLKEIYGVEPLCFATLEDAKPYLATCILAFIDFYLGGVYTAEEARQKHAEVKDELSTKFAFNGAKWPKVIVLVSSALPDHDGLSVFRKATGIKSAFFQTLDKKNIEAAFVESTLRRCLEQYVAATKLNGYLESVQEEILAVANDIREEVAKLELHDLTALKALRLDAESESVQAYITWLLSEAMASRLRAAEVLQRPVLPPEGEYALLDGKLLPGSVLFELFSDIAVAPLPSAEDETKIAFGDVLVRVLPVENPPQPQQLILVISPACDLARCLLDYEVLCVHGAILDTSPSLQDLLSKAYEFGKGSLVLKHKGHDGWQYSRIKWQIKRLTSVVVNDLKDHAKYKRIARLAEVFAQEVKDLALSQVSRVGTPIDPSFSVALQALVRLNIPAGKGAQPIEFVADLSEFDYVPAVMAMGREAKLSGDNDSDKPLEKTVIFSRQFIEWLQSKLDELKQAHNITKLNNISEHFGEPTSYKVALNASSQASAVNGDVKISYTDSQPEATTVKGLEIYLFPYERITKH